MKDLIPETINRRIDAIGRNEPDEAEAIAHALVYAIGYVPAATMHYLVMLQDDGEGMRKRLHGLKTHPAPGVAEVL